MKGNEYSHRQIFVSLLIIFLCCAISYWPVSAGIFSLKNDAVRYFLPVRYQISEMILHGQFPFWTPYINLGHPLYTDMQSGVWNPLVWLISLFGSYSMRSLQAELLIYVYLSGVSMFCLLKYFKLNRSVSLALSVCYMLSGFISDSTQFLYWICAMAFLPFVFLYFLKTAREFSFKSTLLLSVSLYFLFVTGYPGQFIIITYFLIAFLLYFIIKNRKDAIKVFRHLLLASILFVLFSLPALISYISGLSYITRGSSISHNLALTNSMHPFTLISYIFPLTVWKLPITETDILGRNSFIGLLPFLLVIPGLFIKTKNSLIVFLKWVFIISLVLSFGKFGLLRSATYYILPYMDTFRHPSIFRFLSVFCGCILAAFTLNTILINEISESIKKKSFSALVILMILTFFAVLMLSGTGFYNLIPDSFSTSSIKSWFDHSTINNWLIIELLIQVPFLILINQYFIKKINLPLITNIIILNSVIHCILLQPVTVVGTETVSSFQSKINSVKRNGFPLPNLDSSLLSNSNHINFPVPEYGPENMYNKKIGYQLDFITPGPLKLREEFMISGTTRDKILNFPLLYKADTACLYSDSPDFPEDKKFILTNDFELLNYINSYSIVSGYKTSMLKFSPGEWEFEIESGTDGFYCLQQNYYPRWELSVNGKKDSIYICNTAEIGFKLKKGKNKVKLEFKHGLIKNSLYLQLVLFILLIAYLIWYNKKAK